MFVIDFEIDLLRLRLSQAAVEEEWRVEAEAWLDDLRKSRDALRVLKEKAFDAQVVQRPSR